MGPIARSRVRHRRSPRHHAPIADAYGLIQQGVMDALTTQLGPWDDAQIVQQDSAAGMVQVSRNSEGGVSDGIGIPVLRAYGSTTVGSQRGPQAGDWAVTHVRGPGNHRVIGYLGGARSPAVTTAVSAAMSGAARLMVVTAASTTVTLPAASGVDPGDVYAVKNTASGSSTTVASAGGTINGSSTFSLSAANAGALFASDGTNWHVVSAS